MHDEPRLADLHRCTTPADADRADCSILTRWGEISKLGAYSIALPVGNDAIAVKSMA